MSSLAPAPTGPRRHGTAGAGHAAVTGTRSVGTDGAEQGHGPGRRTANGGVPNRPAQPPTAASPAHGGLTVPVSAAAAVAAGAVATDASVPATAAAFDALYASVAARLTWQAYLLTANRHRAAHCVRRSFQLAWTNWAEVSADASPEGWLRATAFELALSPWHHVGRSLEEALGLPRRRLRGATAEHAGLPLTDRDRSLLKALQRLPRAQRRALVLHDVVGLDWSQTAAEVEASTPVTFGRVARGRRAMARAVPALVGADADVPGFGRRLGRQLRGAAERTCAGTSLHAPARVTRARARLHDGGLTLAAGALTVAMAGFLGGSLVWGTPMHPAPQPIVLHPTQATIGVADAVPAATQPKRLPAAPFTPYATGSGVAPKQPGSDAKSAQHSGSRAWGHGGSGRGGAGSGGAGRGDAGGSGADGSGAGGSGAGGGHGAEAARVQHGHGHGHQPASGHHR